MARALLFGTPVSPGIAIGTVRFMHRMRQDEERRIGPDQVAAEQNVLRAAADDVRTALQGTMENVPEDLSDYRDVIAAQMEIVRDPKLLNAALARIERKQICAAWALKLTVDELCALFRGMDDPYLRDRAQDIRAVGLRLRDRLTTGPDQDADPTPGVLAAENISRRTSWSWTWTKCWASSPPRAAPPHTRPSSRAGCTFLGWRESRVWWILPASGRPSLWTAWAAACC